MSTVTTEKTRRSRSWNLQSIFTLKFRRKKTPETKRKHPFKPKDISSSISFDNSLPNKNYIQTKPLQDVRNHQENRKETVSSETVSNHHRLYASRTSLNSKRNRR